MPTIPIPIDTDDVSVRPLDPVICDECDAPATHTVELDIREACLKTTLGGFCEYHANRMADSVRLALPKPKEE
jgi:hypothetical protein